MIDNSDVVTLDGVRIGLSDDVGLLGVKLQGQTAPQSGRTVVLRYAGSGNWQEFIDILTTLAASGAGAIEIHEAGSTGAPLLTLRKRRAGSVPGLDTPFRPDPLMLLVELDPDGLLLLNLERVGEVADPAGLKNRLAQIFQSRVAGRVYKPGLERRTDIPAGQRIEKTVFVKASLSQPAARVLKLIAVVKSTGADVGIQVEALRP